MQQKNAKTVEVPFSTPGYVSAKTTLCFFQAAEYHFVTPPLTIAEKLQGIKLEISQRYINKPFSYQKDSRKH